MRLRVILNCDNGSVLTYNYNHYLFKTINCAVHRTRTLGHKNCRDSSLFTFSQLYFDEYQTIKEGIKSLGTGVHWYISSPKSYFLEGVLKGLKEAGRVKVGNTAMDIHDIEVLADPEISSEMEFSCMSPITVAQCKEAGGRSRYGRIEDRDFTERLRQDLINKYYRVSDSLPENDAVSFHFNQEYIKNKRRVSRLVDFNGVKILGYMLPFKVKGNPQLIQVGYQLGFGNKNKCGFGMVKVWYSPDQKSNDQVG